MRLCDDCGVKMDPYVPRSRSGDQMLCPACLERPRGGMVSASKSSGRKTMSSIRVQAHDSGDQFRIFHCPMCGSGQVTARSDGAVECGFCGINFMVRLQPSYPAFPQTVDGVPVEIPGMPNAEPTQGTAMDGQDSLGQEDPINPEDVSEEEAEEENPDIQPQDEELAKKSYKTASGVLVSEEDYLRHLAIEFSGRSPEVLRAVKASRMGQN